MDNFEICLNETLVDIFNNIIKFEEMSLKKIANNTVTVSEAHMLEAIEKLDNKATVSEIAANLRVAVPTVTVALKKLEQKGLITKLQCKNDGRRVFISLSRLGEKINKAHAYFHLKMVRNISQNFLDNEKEILLHAINKLNVFFREKVEA